MVATGAGRAILHGHGWARGQAQGRVTNVFATELRPYCDEVCDVMEHTRKWLSVITLEHELCVRTRDLYALNVGHKLIPKPT